MMAVPMLISVNSNIVVSRRRVRLPGSVWATSHGRRNGSVGFSRLAAAGSGTNRDHRVGPGASAARC